MNLYKESEMFNQAAEYYDKYRPGYPYEIIDYFCFFWTKLYIVF